MLSDMVAESFAFYCSESSTLISALKFPMIFLYADEQRLRYALVS